MTEPGDNLKCSFAVFLVLINIVKRGGDGSKSGVSFFDFCSRMLHCVGNISIKFHERKHCMQNQKIKCFNEEINMHRIGIRINLLP